MNSGCLNGCLQRSRSSACMVGCSKRREDVWRWLGSGEEACEFWFLFFWREVRRVPSVIMAVMKLRLKCKVKFNIWEMAGEQGGGW